MSAICPHEKVIVNYLHELVDVNDAPIETLQKEVDWDSSPDYMTLELPRCADCGAALGWEELKSRIRPNGDLFDARFIWVKVKPKWMFWRGGYRFR